MYQISVPVMNSNIKPADRERLLREVRRFDAKRVFLALDRYELDPERRARVMESLRENCRFFKEQGFEVGAWVWAFLVKGNTQFQCMRSLNGTEITAFMCPSDPAFLDFACAYVQDVARCGVDLIMFDDDFRYGFLSDSPACLCPNHLRMIGELVGEEVTVQTVRESVISGKRNKYRDAYLQANGDCLRQFASRIRAAARRLFRLRAAKR